MEKQAHILSQCPSPGASLLDRPCSTWTTCAPPRASFGTALDHAFSCHAVTRAQARAQAAGSSSLVEPGTCRRVQQPKHAIHAYMRTMRSSSPGLGRACLSLRPQM